MKKIILLLATTTFLFGCTHQGLVSSVSATNIYSGFDSKILGGVTYTMDDTSLSILKNDDAVTGLQCAGHRFPVDGEDALKISIPIMLRSIFENDPQKSSMPQKDTIHLVFRVEHFEPKLKFNPKFLSVDADATVELGISATGTLNGKRVFGSAVDGQRTKSGDAGAFCSGGADVLADATRATIKDVLEKMGERLSNSQTLRSK